MEDISINFAGQDVLAKTPAQAARLAAREEERKEAERSLAAASDKATLRMTRRRAEFFLNLGYHEAMEKHGRRVTNLVEKGDALRRIGITGIRKDRIDFIIKIATLVAALVAAFRAGD